LFVYIERANFTGFCQINFTDSELKLSSNFCFISPPTHRLVFVQATQSVSRHDELFSYGTMSHVKHQSSRKGLFGVRAFGREAKQFRRQSPSSKPRLSFLSPVSRQCNWRHTCDCRAKADMEPKCQCSFLVSYEKLLNVEYNL